MVTSAKKSPESIALDSLTKRMDVIISLLFRMVGKDATELPLKEQIAALDNLGIRPVEISQIVGRTQTHVNKELVAIRRNRAVKK